MVKTESFEQNGIWYTKTYSDKGLLIERDGVLYEDAIDPVGANRVYVETATYIDTDASEQDYINALREMGVDV